MKKSLLAGAAAIALIAVPGLASAQRQEAPPSKSEAPAPAPKSIQNAPAEKVGPAGKAARDSADSKTEKPAGTTGQASPSPSRGATQDKVESKQPSAAPNAQSGTAPKTESGTTAQGGAAAQPSGAAVNLTAEQKTKVRTTVLQGSNVPRATNVNFSINVGTVVPRTVRLVAVPTTLVEIHPRWRGYMYFVHGDEIIIVEPKTLKIVAVVVV